MNSLRVNEWFEIDNCLLIAELARVEKRKARRKARKAQLGFLSRLDRLKKPFSKARDAQGD